MCNEDNGTICMFCYNYTECPATVEFSVKWPNSASTKHSMCVCGHCAADAGMELVERVAREHYLDINQFVEIGEVKALIRERVKKIKKKMKKDAKKKKKKK